MDEETKVYYKIARLLASCPKDRMKLVLKVLEGGGINVDGFTNLIDEMNREEKAKVYERRTREEKRDLWLDSDDPATLLMRKAYDRGVSMTVISGMTGVHRTTLYKYLRGTVKPKELARKSVTDAIEKIFADIDGEMEA